MNRTSVFLFSVSCWTTQTGLTPTLELLRAPSFAQAVLQTRVDPSYPGIAAAAAGSHGTGLSLEHNTLPERLLALLGYERQPSIQLLALRVATLLCQPERRPGSGTIQRLELQSVQQRQLSSPVAADGAYLMGTVRR